MTLIGDSSELKTFCDRLSGAEFVTVDTEFMRERTFWPKLCLVQLAGPGDDDSDAVAIDALVPDLDLGPLFRLLTAPETVKVFHAGRQDFEIFLHLMGRLPAPVFDTQVAAMVLGFGDQAGYETLAAQVAKAKVDKGSRFSDWSLRPLSDKQIAYALADVTHLRPIYRRLSRDLETSGRAAWVSEEMADLTDPDSYRTEPHQAWRRLRIRSGRGRFLAVLREVAAWRENEAQARDVPRAWIVRDEGLLEIAHNAPKTAAELARTRGLARKWAEGELGEGVLAAVARGLAVPESEWPVAETRREPPRGTGPVAELLKVLLKMKCEKQKVAQKLVASADDIDRIAALGASADVPALSGWRRQVFGEDALRLHAGEVALVVKNRKLALVALTADEAKAGAKNADQSP
jgi:ribonuclease D